MNSQIVKVWKHTRCWSIIYGYGLYQSGKDLSRMYMYIPWTYVNMFMFYYELKVIMKKKAVYATYTRRPNQKKKGGKRTNGTAGLKITNKTAEKRTNGTANKHRSARNYTQVLCQDCYSRLNRFIVLVCIRTWERDVGLPKQIIRSGGLRND